MKICSKSKYMFKKIVEWLFSFKTRNKHFMWVRRIVFFLLPFSLSTFLWTHKTFGWINDDAAAFAKNEQKKEIISEFATYRFSVGHTISSYYFIGLSACALVLSSDIIFVIEASPHGQNEAAVQLEKETQKNDNRQWNAFWILWMFTQHPIEFSIIAYSSFARTMSCARVLCVYD